MVILIPELEINVLVRGAYRPGLYEVVTDYRVDLWTKSEIDWLLSLKKRFDKQGERRNETCIALSSVDQLWKRNQETKR